MKKKLLLILGILVFIMFSVRVYAEQEFAITYGTEGEGEDIYLGYEEGNIYTLQTSNSYKLYYELHDREDGYCIYVTTNNGNAYHNHIDCNENINSGYYDGTFNANNLDNHEYTFGFVLETDVINATCPQFSNYAEGDKKYFTNGCGDLNVVNITNVTVQNPYNRQNEILVKSINVNDKYYDTDNTTTATVEFEGTYYLNDLVYGTDYTVEVYFNDSDASNEPKNAQVIITLINGATNKYYLRQNIFDRTAHINPYVIKESDIIANDDNTIRIMYMGMTLVENTDYTVEYNENNNMITATVSGLGNYDATEVQKTFEKAFNGNSFVQELIDDVLEENIIVDTANDDYRTNNSLNYKSFVYDILNNRVKKDNVGNWINMRSCTNTSCFVDFVRHNNEDNNNYAINNVEVPYTVFGFIIDDLIDAYIGDVLTINYRFVDENGHEQQVLLKKVYTTYDYDEYVEIINDNKIKVLKQGIFPVEVSFEYNEVVYDKKVYIFSEIPQMISNALNKSSKFYANKARYSYYDLPMEVAERTFVDDIIGNNWLDYRIDSNYVCNEENCREVLEGNFDFNFIIGSKTYSVKKNNITIVPFGIKFNGEIYPSIDIKLGTPMQIDYTLYSNSAVWQSSNPEVATVDSNGLVTPISEGATIISATIERDVFESVIVRVEPTEGTFKTRLTNLLNTKLNGRTTLDALAISTLNEDFLKNRVNDVIYEMLVFDDENVIVSVEVSDDYRTAYVFLGYKYYDLELPNGDTDYISYCKYSDWDEGFDCNTDVVELSIVYEDDKPNFDATLVSKAQALLEKIDFVEEHYSFINDSLSDYVDSIENNRESYNIIGKYSDFNKLIENEDGFTFEFIGRVGGAIAHAGGDGFIQKDGVVYAVPVFMDEEGYEYTMIGIVEAVGIAGHPETEEEKLSAVRKVVTDRVDSSRYDIIVEKASDELVEIELGDEEEGEYYNIYFHDKNDEEKGYSMYVKLVTDYEGGNNVDPQGPVNPDDPEEPAIIVNNINVEGIVIPKENERVDLSNLNITTDGVSVKHAYWYKDEVDWMSKNPVTTFAANQRYMLRIELEVASGYQLSNDFSEDNLTLNAVPLRREYVHDASDIRLYYDSIELPKVTTAPTVTVTNANDNTLLVSYNEVENATSYEIYRSTSKTSGFKKIKTLETNSYTDTGLTYGTTYYYKVIAKNAISNKTSSVVSGKTVPNQVENLHVESIGSTNVKVGYNKVNVTGYEVQYGTSTSKMTSAGYVTNNNTVTYNKTGLKANTTYYFKVRAYKTVGKTKVFGAFSDIISVKTGPSAPSISVSNKDYKTLNVKINSVTGATLYKLEESTDNKNYSIVDEFESATIYEAKDLIPGTTYYYRVQAFNAEGSSSSYSSVVSKKVIPNAPIITVTKSSDNKVVVKSNEQEGVTGYSIYRSTNKTKNYKFIGSTETEEYNDSLTYGTTYYYKVIAYNASSSSNYSNIVSIKVLPEKVNNIVDDTVNSTSIKISYDKVNVTGYEIHFGTSTKKIKNVKTITSSSTLSYTKTGLKANTTYYFKVRAYQKVGSKKIYGQFSNVLTIKTSPYTPKVSLSIKEYNEMNITIGSVSGATKYVVEKSLDGSEYTLVEEASTSKTIVQSDLSIGTKYYYRVKACNSVNNCSAWTNVNKVQTTKVPTFTLSTTSKKVTVKLTGVEEAEGYEVYRSNYSNKKFTLVKTFTNEDELLEFVNTTSKRKTYYYKVRSYKVVEDNKVYSDYSSVKKIKSK